MASDESYLEYVLGLLAGVEHVSSRKMMGEYLLYADDILFGGIYDDRLMLKVTPSSRNLFPHAALESPYPGAQEMILVDSENPEQLAHVVTAMLPELPARKPRTKRN